MAIRSINKVVDHLKNNENLVLKDPKLDIESMHLRIYSDASFATNSDHMSQLGYITFFMDKFNKCQPIYWTSYKSERVCTSVLGSKVMAFADAFDLA